MEKGLPRKSGAGRMDIELVIIAIREPSVNSLLFNPFLIPIVAIVGYFGFKAIEAVSSSCTAVSRQKSETELKLVLAQRGMSADEIIRVVSAGREELNVGENGINAAPLPPSKGQPATRYASSTLADTTSY